DGTPSLPAPSRQAGLRGRCIDRGGHPLRPRHAQRVTSLGPDRRAVPLPVLLEHGPHSGVHLRRSCLRQGEATSRPPAPFPRHRHPCGCLGLAPTCPSILASDALRNGPPAGGGRPGRAGSLLVPDCPRARATWTSLSRGAQPSPRIAPPGPPAILVPIDTWGRSLIMRTHYCGRVSPQELGTTVSLAGWVNRRRDFGAITFVDLRDRSGIIQVVFDGDDDALSDAHTLNREDVVQITGTVSARSQETVNPEMSTGTLEIRAQHLTVLNRSKTPPFLVDGDGTDTTEETRLRYRYVDLRREKLQRSLGLRHRVFKSIRDFFSDEGFWEIETPFLTKSTPEGARDFLVPSRMHPHAFYALPQSPQLFKQLFMVGGIDRYFQMVKCFRDEDLRADRQPEFTQLDLEMAFPNGKEEIFSLLEGALARTFRETLGIELEIPFPRLSHGEALRRFGSDKPDLRYGVEIRDVSSLVANCGFSVFTQAIASGGRVAGLLATGCGAYSRSMLDDLQAVAVKAGAQGMAWIKVEAGSAPSSPIAKFLTVEELAALIEAFAATPGDLILLLAGQNVETPLGALRTALAKRESWAANNAWSFLWVTDFPLFELDDAGQITSSHHPFTSPSTTDIQ
ncbi:MAG TPA: aspartate--tRNA ligase, partial [Candidatus Acetothermia bacterium]|nr:aspartate--tRNA ligase [Candidatus Acetothermia bacterium]